MMEFVFRGLVCLLALIGSDAYGQIFFQGQAARPGATTYDGLVATRGVMPSGGLQTTLKQGMSRTGHFTRSSVSQIKIVSANTYGSENAPGAATTLTASIEYPQGTCTQLLFGGSATGTIPDGGLLTSDYLTISIPTNTKFWVRQYYTNTAGLVNAVNYSNAADMGDAYDAAASGITDKTVSCTSVTNTFSNLTYQPIAIVAPITTPSVCIPGDSIAYGTDDTGNTNGDQGIVARSIGPSFGYSVMAVPGETATTFNSSQGANRRAIFAYCSHRVVEYGTNDIGSGSASLQTQLTTIYNDTPAAISFQTTIVPRTTSTDSWATTANQTTISSESNRVTFNNSLRTGSFGPNGGMFDTGAQLETNISPSSGLWKAGAGFSACAPWTNDGVHPDTCAYGQVQSSGAVDTSRITR